MSPEPHLNPRNSNTGPPTLESPHFRLVYVISMNLTSSLSNFM
jgi:hypothetical protein